MNRIRELHEKAMDLAEEAFVAKLRGNLEQAKQLIRQAFEGEAQAARLVPNDPSSEPTRSILYRSAASLALDCNEFDEAERLIAAGLAGNPPKEIAEELKELSEKVNLQPHRDVLDPSLNKDKVGSTRHQSKREKRHGIRRKPDLVSAVAEIGMTKKQAAAAVDAFFAAIKGSLAKGEKVSLVGFGSFSVKKRATRTGRNPRTGRPLNIPDKKVPAFSPGKGLKDAVS